MVGVVLEPPRAARPGHDVEVIHLVPVKGGTRVIPLWHQNQIPVLDGHGLVKAAVVGIDPLDAKAGVGIDPVIIGFLQIGFVRVGVGVVLVAWIA